MNKYKLLGPFAQLITMNGLPIKGALKDEQLEIIKQGGVLIQNEKIIKVGVFDNLLKTHDKENTIVEKQEENFVALPGFIDAHTHICFGGTRAKDFAARNNGKTYLEIAANGGGIWDTVKQTRQASEAELESLMVQRINRLASNGITTVEVKSGYGLGIEHELKLLRVIQKLQNLCIIDIIPTCLAAHIVPKEYENENQYLADILANLVPVIKAKNLCKRFDIFIEKEAFSVEASKNYLNKLKAQNFEITVHGDQFTTGGSQVAIDCGALSVDHLEASTEKEIIAISKSDVIPVALPGASIGLGCAFTPARKLLDAGCSLAIASDWNPGSAPQGDLLIQASILSTFEKLSAAEVFAGITFRAAKVLNMTDRGKVAKGQLADIIAFKTSDFREILYQQGILKPTRVWKKGILI